MRLFDLDKATASTERFERYFISALKKRCSSLKRDSLTKKRKEENNTVSFSRKQHDIADERITPIVDELSIQDVARFCKTNLKDLGITLRKLDGYTAGEICQLLSLSPKRYRSIMNRVRSNSLIQRYGEVNK